MSLSIIVSRKCQFMDTGEEFRKVIFECNITHNLIKMAREAGVFEALWRFEESGFSVAHDITLQLDLAVSKMLAREDSLKEFEPKNGWGSFEGFLKVVKELLQICKENPQATINTHG